MKWTLLKEFKEFAVKGNMIDIAIGVIIGAAFNKVVDVLVKQVLMPPLALMTNGTNWEDKRIVLQQAVIENETTTVEEIAIGYGKLIEAGVDFVIIGFTVFIVVKLMNNLKKKADDPQNTAEVTPKDIELLHKMTVLMEEQLEQLKELKK
jgi:large conductance mechanosensitive channel